MDTMRLQKYTDVFSDLLEIDDEPCEGRDAKSIWGTPEREPEPANPTERSTREASDPPVLLFDSSGWCFRDNDEALELKAHTLRPAMNSVLVTPTIQI